uniref:B30.2/SPRY domain-containing protein n=1 Tax=Acanthochromis polyacanthus TaxID=80966 RepID=A0A3Q1GWP6_9TELE
TAHVRKVRHFCYSFFHAFYSILTFNPKKNTIFCQLLNDSRIIGLKLKEEMQDRLKDTWTSVCQIISLPDFLVPEPEPGSGLEPKTRAGFLRYSRDITLDPNTANTNLFLSHGDRKITAANHQQSYPDHPDRFSGFSQVLSRESLTGRCYWEVEMTARGFSIAVSYKSINRAENDHMFGCNDKSWALRSLYDLFTFVYNNTITPISGPHSSRIGVYLDHSAGILSFYSVSETMTLLHTVQTTFTEPSPYTSGGYVRGPTQIISKDQHKVKLYEPSRPDEYL